MFSNLSASSISLATVTPSLVIRGAPKLLSRTTLRPFGPRVTFTASARISTPRSMRSRASWEKRTSLAAMVHDSSNKVEIVRGIDDLGGFLFAFACGLGMVLDDTENVAFFH